MLSILLVLILIWHFYIGYSRGIILQTYYFIASIVSLVIASQFYQILAEKITLWIPYSNASQGATVNFFTDVNIFDLDQVYYAGVALQPFMWWFICFFVSSVFWCIWRQSITLIMLK